MINQWNSNGNIKKRKRIPMEIVIIMAYGPLKGPQTMKLLFFSWFYLINCFAHNGRCEELYQSVCIESIALSFAHRWKRHLSWNEKKALILMANHPCPYRKLGPLPVNRRQQRFFRLLQQRLDASREFFFFYYIF